MENKNILITGATGGLGKAFCREIAKKYKNLVLTGTSQEKLNNFKKELLEENENLNILVFPCNLAEYNERKSLLEFLDSNNIKVNYLINNAGFITEGSVKHASTETLLKCIQVNCEGTIHLTKEIIARKEEHENLKIITISSLAGNYPLPYMAIYSSTKALLKNFILAIREEYKNDNINFLLVQPGAIATSQDMKMAIEAQGLKGKLSSVSPETIAKKSIKKCDKNKKLYIPGFFNKLTDFVSKITPLSLQIKVAGSMWKKSQAKRNIK